MTTILGRLYKCFCGSQSHSWQGAVTHIAVRHLDGDFALARVLTTIKLESTQEASN